MHGLSQNLGKITVKKFADQKEANTTLLCPNCFAEGRTVKPKWTGGYDCEECGSHYNHWSNLKRVLNSNGQPVHKERLIEKGEKPVANLYVIPLEKFADYVDATSNEYGVEAEDKTAAENLRKLLIASEKLNKVIVILFNDTYEERICILTTSISNRILLKEIIPLNLLLVKETLTVSLEEVTPEEIAEAQEFVKLLPTATEEMFTVDDYRTEGIEATIESPKAVQLEEILKKVKVKPTVA